MAVLCFSKNLFNMNRIEGIGSIIMLSLTDKRRTSAPEHFSFDGQRVAAI